MGYEHSQDDESIDIFDNEDVEVDDYQDDILDDEDLEAIAHYGMPRRSGRYPWGSGENPYQR